MERCCRARLALDGAECQAREHSRKVRREVKGSGTHATTVPREQSLQSVQRGSSPLPSVPIALRPQEARPEPLRVAERPAAAVDGVRRPRVVDAARRADVAQFWAPPTPRSRSWKSGGFSTIWEKRTTVTVSSSETVLP